MALPYAKLATKRAFIELISRPLANLGPMVIYTLALTAIPLLLPVVAPIPILILLRLHLYDFNPTKDTNALELNDPATLALAIVVAAISACCFGPAALFQLVAPVLGVAHITPSLFISMSIGTNIAFVAHRALTMGLSMIQNFINIPLMALFHDTGAPTNTYLTTTAAPNRFYRLLGEVEEETELTGEAHCLNIDRALNPFRWFKPAPQYMDCGGSMINVNEEPLEANPIRLTYFA